MVYFLLRGSANLSKRETTDKLLPPSPEVVTDKNNMYLWRQLENKILKNLTVIK